MPPSCIPRPALAEGIAKAFAREPSPPEAPPPTHPSGSLSPRSSSPQPLLVVGGATAALVAAGGAAGVRGDAPPIMSAGDATAGALPL